MPALDRIHIAGFKSIREQEIELKDLNLLIGANGAGKSNFVAVFELLHAIANERLQVFVGKAGGADSFLHFGRKKTESIELDLRFKRNAYSCVLEPTSEDRLIFFNEVIQYHDQRYATPFDVSIGEGMAETKLYEEREEHGDLSIAGYVTRAFQGWRVYHFHDTSASARVKQTGDLHDNEFLRADAGNLAAFLYRLQRTHEDHYRNIVDTIGMVAPFFDDFRLRPDPTNPEKIRLQWREKGSDEYFGPSALSDGTLRFICLATLLMQPEPPTTILLDEPELGLHPYAIHIVAALLSAAAERTQVIVSTQSVTLVNQFEPEDLLIVERDGPETVFKRLETADLENWMDEYALGELWEKNLLGGRPKR